MYFKEVLFLSLLAVIHIGNTQKMSCPSVRTTSGWLDLFPLPCKKHSECKVMGTTHRCCKGYCTKGVKEAAAIRVTDNEPTTDISVVPISSTTTTSTTSSTSTSTSTSTSPSTTRVTTTTPRPTTTTTTRRTTTTTRRTTTTESPLLPFFQLLPIQTTPKTTPKPAPPNITKQSKPASIKSGKSQSTKLVCPKSAPAVLFPIPCQKTSQCRSSLGTDQVCCAGRCVRGVPAPKVTTPPPTHQPLLGVIPRECPSAPLGELLFEVQSCKSDADCWPRVCCPDGNKSYCRTARARLDLVPIASQINEPVRMIERYLQCTSPPAYDLFPQRCTSSVDCFPNLCCAEGGKKHCRPPQRSILALLAGVTQRFGNLRQGQGNNL